MRRSRALRMRSSCDRSRVSHTVCDVERPSEWLHGLGETVRDIATRQIAPRFQRLEANDVIAKPSRDDPLDVVTAADRDAEAELTECLPALAPGSLVVGEEAAAADPRVLDRLSSQGQVWLVDPLDGTRNFAEGHGPFGTMVALLDRGVCIAACIYSVTTELILLAERGKGAFANGASIARHAAHAGKLRGTLNDKFMPPELAAHLAARAVGHTLQQSDRCAVSEYAQVALGEKQYTVYYRLLPWDHVPGALIVREVGGVARHPDGREYEVADVRGPLLVASTPDDWTRAHRDLFA